MNIIKEMLERADMNTIQTFLQYGCDCALETTIKTYEERLKSARRIALDFFESRFTDIDELDEVTRDFDIQSEVYKDVYFEIGLLSRKRVIRTRLKRRNFGIFWLIVLERRQACLRPLHQNLLEISSG